MRRSPVRRQSARRRRRDATYPAARKAVGTLADAKSGPATRQRPGPWPHLQERCDMDKPTCSIEGCTKPVDARGWCHTHYTRWYRHGDPTVQLRPGGVCSVDGCDRQRNSRGLCSTHYGRWRKWGTTDKPVVPVEVRFWAKVDVGHPLGCWTWIAGRTSRGYGSFGQGGPKRRVYAHRYAYELLVGPIPDGLVIDHLCRNPSCVNPDHLEPVTHQENCRRGVAGVLARRRAARRASA